MSVGNRVFTKRHLAAPSVIDGFHDIPAANVADTMGRSCALSAEIRLLSRPTKSVMVGSALTVKTRAGDNLLLHKALDMAKEGDVIVVSNENDRNRALMGEIMLSLVSCQKKIAGIVLDGPIRDYEEVSQKDFFLYATGSTPGGPYKNGPGEVNVPISCGGVSVNPGDIILGDYDGVIVIPREDAEQILTQARKLKEMDSAKLDAAKTGCAKRDWVDQVLQNTQCEIIDDYYTAGR